MREPKLRLQQGDEYEFRNLFDGDTSGRGKVTQAYSLLRSQVAKSDVIALFRGLERFRVVNIVLDEIEDPQQVFERLNAKGLQLAESEKVKNWLLIKMHENDQRHYHDTFWQEIETALGGKHDATKVDEFLQHLLRWWTGEPIGAKRVYGTLKREAPKRFKEAGDFRPKLLRELARLAKLYGMITGTNEGHSNKRIRKSLFHLQEMEFKTYRPFVLRLLDDAQKRSEVPAASEEAARVIERVGTWITRLWLAGGRTGALNITCAEFAKLPGPDDGEDYVDYWVGKISDLRRSRTQMAVPDKKSVQEGILRRTAYGGRSKDTTRAVLCAMMEHEHGEQEATRRESLTIEHIMPQKLNPKWRSYLGDEADDIHTEWRNRLANLTLIGAENNSKGGASDFDTKKEQIYSRTPIGMTRRLAGVAKWDEEALGTRSAELADVALDIWGWEQAGQAVRRASAHPAQMRWRINEGNWQDEKTARQMLRNVTAALLSLDPRHVTSLSGNTISKDLIHRSQLDDEAPYRNKLSDVPGHENYLIYSNLNAKIIVDRCCEFGIRCGVNVEVEHPESSESTEFWKNLWEVTGGVPGQTEKWSSWEVTTNPLNTSRDQIGIKLKNGKCFIYVTAWNQPNSVERAERMRRYSRRLQEVMGDQEFSDDVEENAEKGSSISVCLWSAPIEDKGAWPTIASWICEQAKRIRAVIADQPASAAS